MFVGHYALAFGAKRIVPGVSLGALFLACQLADLVWPSLVLAGIERVEIDPHATAFTPLDFVRYPYSHSLLALALWGVLIGAAYVVARRSPVRTGAVLALLVVSHWVLDYVTHRPDMPLTFSGSTRVGLGLWRSVPGTVGLELSLFAAGIGIYLRTTRPRDRIGSIGLAALVVFLLVTYVANVLAPPPSSSHTVAWTVQALWLLVAWGYWIDRHRAARGRPAAALSTNYP